MVRFDSAIASLYGVFLMCPLTCRTLLALMFFIVGIDACGISAPLSLLIFMVNSYVNCLFQINFPFLLFIQVTETKLDSFLDTSETNKPSIILLSTKPLPSLLYQLVAFSNKEWQSFGFVSLKDSSAESIRKRFHADNENPTVMIFKDNAAVPDVVVMVISLTQFFCFFVLFF